MHTINLPVGGPIAQLSGLAFFLIAGIGLLSWVLWQYVIYREAIAADAAVRLERRSVVVRRLQYAVYMQMFPTVGVAALSLIAATLIIWQPEFHAICYDNNGILLRYGLWRDPFILWSDIENVRLVKARPRSHWRIAITARDGREYKSAHAPTYREVEAMASAKAHLVQKREQYASMDSTGSKRQ